MGKWTLLVLIVIAAMAFAGPRDRATVEREVAQLNAILELHNSSWSAGVTCMSMLSEAEAQEMMGLLPTEVDRDEFAYDSRQWPANGKEVLVANITRVKNQAQCGSCVSFGTTAVFEQTYTTKFSDSKLFSERYLFFCSPYTGYGCNGGWSLDGGAVAASNSGKGMIEDQHCKYTDGGSYYYDCGQGCNTGSKKYTMGYKRVSASDYIRILNGNRAIIIGMIVYDDFRSYKEGAYEHLTGQRLGGHCMALVGYGTTADGKHYWVIKNSWSANWGKDGYVRVLIKPEQKLKDSNVEDYGGYYFE